MSTASKEWLSGEGPCQGNTGISEEVKGSGLLSPYFPRENHPPQLWSSPELPQPCCSLTGYMDRDGGPGDTPLFSLHHRPGLPWGLLEEGQAGEAQRDSTHMKPSRIGTGEGTGRHICPCHQISQVLQTLHHLFGHALSPGGRFFLLPGQNGSCSWPEPPSLLGEKAPTSSQPTPCFHSSNLIPPAHPSLQHC